MKNFALAAVCGFFSLSGYGQYEEILTSNRPSIAISAWTIGAKTFQLENGVNFTTASSTGVKAQDLSDELFARIGLSERVEANVTVGAGNSATWLGGVRSSTGLNLWTLDVGARLKILKGNRFKPDLLFQGSFRTWTKSGYDPGAKLLLATNNTFGLFYFSTTFGAAFPNLFGKADFTYAICPEFYVRKNISVYAEVFGWFDDFNHPGFDAGVAIAPINDLQIDIYGGYITGGAVRTAFGEIGISWRTDWRKKSQ